jgi:simple sugar transport system permease protein
MLTIGTVTENGFSRFAYKQFEGLISTFVPLVLTSVALSIAFKMRFWNIGGEGQFLMGAVAAAIIPLRFGLIANSAFVTLVLMALVAMLAAAAWGGIIAVFRVRFGTNETLMTLMFNYIALYIVALLGEEKAKWNFFLREDSQRPIFRSVWEVVQLPVIKIGNFSLSISVILVLAICVFIWFYLKKTKHGYEINVVGDSVGTAKYAGMKVNRIMVRTMLVSSALVGLAGFFKLMSAGPLSTSLTDSAGWTGVVVAWLAKLDTVGIVITALLISVLRFGCAQASIEFGAIDSRFSDLLQGMILFAVHFADFLIRFKIAKKEETVHGS